MQGREKNISVKHFFVIKLSSGGLGKSSVFFLALGRLVDVYTSMSVRLSFALPVSFV